MLYIPGTKCNLLSIIQFLEKDYNIHTENKMLHVMDADKVFVLKAYMAPKRLSKLS